MQAQHITTKVVGVGHKTVISLDMGLYKPTKQLQMSRSDLDHLLLRPGELHIVMSQLRCISAYTSWVESGIYGPVTVKKIVEGKHVKRGVEAHLLTLQALFTVYQEAFFEKHQSLRAVLSGKAENIDRACTSGDTEEILKAHNAMLQALVTHDVERKMDIFEHDRNSSPLFVATCNYMSMAMTMNLFIRAVHTRNWELHLSALGAFCKHFFALDMLNYARMIPVYLAEVESLKNDHLLYEEFRSGTWVVNKNTTVPCCSIGQIMH